MTNESKPEAVERFDYSEVPHGVWSTYDPNKGEYVLFTDYQKLVAENERLKKVEKTLSDELNTLEEEGANYDTDVMNMTARIAELEAQPVQRKYPPAEGHCDEMLRLHAGTKKAQPKPVVQGKPLVWMEHDRFLEGWGVPDDCIARFQGGNITVYSSDPRAIAMSEWPFTTTTRSEADVRRESLQEVMQAALEIPVMAEGRREFLQKIAALRAREKDDGPTQI